MPAISQLLGPANLAADLYTQALSAAYRRGVRVYDPDYAASHDPEAYEKLRRDPVVAKAMQIRRHAVAGQRWFMRPASDLEDDVIAAKVVGQLVAEVSRFSAGRFNLAEAVFNGQTFAKIDGHRALRQYGDGVTRKWFVPTRLRDIHKWRLRQVRDMRDEADIRESGIRTTWEMFNVSTQSWETITAAQRRMLVVHTYEDKEDTLGYGRGLIEALYHFYWLKTSTLREVMQGIERWGQGWIVAGVDGLREGSTTKTNADVTSAWLDALEKSRGRHAFVHDNEDTINIHETSGSGNDIGMGMLRYLDEAMVGLVLGAVLPSGSSNKQGSFARAKIEDQTSEALMQYDRELLGETLTRDLVGMIWRLNRANLVSLGLGNARMPKLMIQSQTKADPIKTTEATLKALAVGLPFKRDEVYAKLEFTPPAVGDEVIDLSSATSEGGRDPLTGQFAKPGKDG